MSIIPETRTSIALQDRRAVAQMTVEALAEASGVSAPTIAAIELGRVRRPQAVTLGKLAKALGCTVAELRGRELERAGVNK